jgi:hypothetical protein
MILKHWCIWILLVTSIFPKVAPEFFEVNHYIQGDILDNNNAINYVFNGTVLQRPDKNSIAIAHQNREWEYNWFVTAAIIPTRWGTLGAGYSNYSSPRLPVTQKSEMFYSISEYTSDTFSMAWVSYQPHLKNINIQFLAHIKHRELHNQSAKAQMFDIRVSSPKILNNQLGLKTTNLLGKEYKWGNGRTEALPQYIGVYYIQPIGMLTVAVQQEGALNYSDLNIFMGHALLAFDPSLNIIASYRETNYMTSLGFGINFKLTEVLALNYLYANEKNDILENSIYTLSVGVKY